MPHRTFRDVEGREWQVWQVVPQSYERRTGQVAPIDVPDRRQRAEVRLSVQHEWAKGWLVFESGGEKRRLAVFPRSWATASERDLQRMCEIAEPAKPRRTGGR